MATILREIPITTENIPLMTEFSLLSTRIFEDFIAEGDENKVLICYLDGSIRVSDKTRQL